MRAELKEKTQKGLFNNYPPNAGFATCKGGNANIFSLAPWHYVVSGIGVWVFAQEALTTLKMAFQLCIVGAHQEPSC